MRLALPISSVRLGSFDLAREMMNVPWVRIGSSYEYIMGRVRIRIV